MFFYSQNLKKIKNTVLSNFQISLYHPRQIQGGFKSSSLLLSRYVAVHWGYFQS